MSLIYGVAEIEIVESDPLTGKPYLQITMGDLHFGITTNVAEMIGGVGQGARLRWQDQQKEKGPPPG